jgi:hypothetical protein
VVYRRNSVSAVPRQPDAGVQAFIQSSGITSSRFVVANPPPILVGIAKEGRVFKGFEKRLCLQKSNALHWSDPRTPRTALAINQLDHGHSVRIQTRDDLA